MRGAAKQMYEKCRHDGKVKEFVDERVKAIEKGNKKKIKKKLYGRLYKYGPNSATHTKKIQLLQDISCSLIFQPIESCISFIVMETLFDTLGVVVVVVVVVFIILLGQSPQTVSLFTGCPR